MTIYSFGFENFYSFEAATDVSFVMDKRSSFNEKSFESPISGERVSKVLAVVGANGSGKTNLIKPLAYMLWFITDSFFESPDHDKSAIHSHIFSEDSLIKFHLEFDADGVRYRYSLVMDHKDVHSESLDKKTSRLWSKVFSREWDALDEKYIISRKGFGSAQIPLDDVRRKVSLISLAAQYKSKEAFAISETLKRFTTNIGMFGRDAYYSSDTKEASLYYSKNEDKRVEMTRFLKDQDFGVEDIFINPYDRTEEDGSVSKQLMPMVTHVRNNKKSWLPLLYESNGTQSAYYLLSKILPLLETGGIMIYDELEGDLHPHMIEPFLNLFFNKRTNPHDAQLIFTTHSLEVLNELQKNQILLVEKNDCSSEAWKLSDMDGVRSDDNFYAKYMSGAYGAIPKI